jgi:hypothetical protein
MMFTSFCLWSYNYYDEKLKLVKYHDIESKILYYMEKKKEEMN